MPAAWAVQPDRTTSRDVRNSGVALDGLRAVDVGGILVLRGTHGRSGPGRGCQRLRPDPRLRARREPRADRDRSTMRPSRAASSVSSAPLASTAAHQIDSQDGVVHISGTVQHELQKDFALEVVRNVDGVKSVRIGPAAFLSRHSPTHTFIGAVGAQAAMPALLFLAYRIVRMKKRTVPPFSPSGACTVCA